MTVSPGPVRRGHRGPAALYAEEHAYQTVVMDRLDWLERLIWAEVCRKRRVETIEDIGYAKGYVFALTQWREVLEGLTALRNRPRHDGDSDRPRPIEHFENPETDTYDRYVPAYKLASALVQEWCDEVLFATYRVHTKPVDEGFDRKRSRARHRRAHVHTAERPAHVAKNRLACRRAAPGLRRLRRVPQASQRR